MDSEDKLITTLDDSEIFEHNVRTIMPKQCVDDMIIHFHFRYLLLKHPEWKSLATFVMPCTVQFIQTYPMEMVKESMYDLKMDNFNFIFFPMSDIDRCSRRATHWSLLYFDRTRPVPKFLHFDSMNQSNKSNAKALASKICELYGISDHSIEFIHGVRQPNGYDCGVYVMAYAEQLLLANGNVKTACANLSHQYISQYRNYVLNNINSYAHEKEMQNQGYQQQKA